MTETVNRSGITPKVVLMGLAEGEGLAEELRNALWREGCAVHLGSLSPHDQALTLINQVEADVVFCPAQPEQYAPLLEAIHLERPELPVVVVSRLPEASAWLDALELGAADYCAPPFEAAQIQWILQSALKAA